MNITRKYKLYTIDLLDINETSKYELNLLNELNLISKQPKGNINQFISILDKTFSKLEINSNIKSYISYELLNTRFIDYYPKSKKVNLNSSYINYIFKNSTFSKVHSSSILRYYIKAFINEDVLLEQT